MRNCLKSFVTQRNSFSPFNPLTSYRYINLYREENLTQEFLEINPSGTVPALVDGDVKVWDSHAIGIYLVQKFAKDDKLYPKDFLKRTAVNERLFFEASFLFARLFEICVSAFLHKCYCVVIRHLLQISVLGSDL